MGFERSYQVGIRSKFILRLNNKFPMLSSLLELELNLCHVFVSCPPAKHHFVTLPLESNINLYKLIKNIQLKVLIFFIKLDLYIDENKAYLHKFFFCLY